jgi:cysteine desulfurase
MRPFSEADKIAFLNSPHTDLLMQAGTSIYLDYQATTPVDPRVREKMTASEELGFANPHSTQHALGQQAEALMTEARTEIEAFIGAQPEEVIFTSGATEANNQAIASVLFANKQDKKRILISEIEHKCVKNAAYFYADKLGCQVEEIPVLTSGLIDIKAYADMLADDVLLVSIMAVNNEIGSIQDIPTLARMAHDNGALFHCDAAQAPEAMDIDVSDWQVDMLSLSAHKAYGPKGIGVLFMKNALQATLPPLIHGGGQQAGMRSGTVPTALCVGFAEALKLSKQDADKSREKLKTLRDRFLNNLHQQGIQLRINGGLDERHPGNLNLEFINILANDLLSALQPEICASTGSACNSEMPTLSHVLLAIGLSDEQAICSIRFSIGRFSDEQQIDKSTTAIASKIKAFLGD